METSSRIDDARKPDFVWLDNEFKDYLPLTKRDVRFVLDINDNHDNSLFASVFPNEGTKSSDKLDYVLIYDVANDVFNLSVFMSNFYMDDKNGDIRSTMDLKKSITSISFTLRGLPDKCYFQSCLIKFSPLYSKFYQSHFIENKGNLYGGGSLSGKIAFNSGKNFG